MIPLLIFLCLRGVVLSRGGEKNRVGVFVGASLTNDEEKDDNDSNDNFLTDEGELSDVLEREFENPGFEVFKDYDVASDEEEMRFQRTLMILEKYHLNGVVFTEEYEHRDVRVHADTRDVGI